jgi:stearoyl-CoA desaturase (delta-9 desaturase)
MTTMEVSSSLAHPTLPTLEAPALGRFPAQRLDLGDWLTSLPFVAVHLAALVGAVLYPPTLALVALCLGVFYVRILGISLGYHRYFAHRTFKTGRALQLVLAVWSMTSAQRGALWWAAHHRDHHKYSDAEGDPHSPARMGFFWSHVGWILSRKNGRTKLEVIRDMSRFPELMWLDRHEYLPAIALGVLLFLLGGWSGLVWGMLLSTVVLWHSTFFINSLAHVWGRRRYPTTDTSRNNFWLALLTGGEGWHNNHHYFCSSARLGFRFWEYDPVWWLLLGLEKLGLVWDVCRPPAHVVAAGASRTD